MTCALLLAGALFLQPAVAPAPRHTLTVSGTTFQLDSQPFPYTGVSFFNALYNPTFNKSSAARREWLEKFRRSGINVLRVWAQWDSNTTFADGGPESTLYDTDGGLRPATVERAKALFTDADSLGMVVELTLFSQESWHKNIRLGKDEADRAVTALTREFQPWRNITFQVWNEFSERTIDHVKTIKAIDPQRLVTSSPGGAGVLQASVAENRALDYLSPHTSRQVSGRPWEIGPSEIEYLLKRFRKPVVDDEPARNGTPLHGGPPEPTSPQDHIIQIYQDWQLGAYVTYHHDMFQTGYGTEAVPPNGIPDPEWSPYHRVVFRFLAQRDRYTPAWYGRR